MNAKSLEKILFGPHLTGNEADDIAALCEKFLLLHWEQKYAEIAKKYPHPVWFPHRLDLAQWHREQNCHFLERGIYSHQIIKKNDRVLDLCCGDGFYSFFFFAKKASHIDALDIDTNALNHAKKYHSASNISYYQQDIVNIPFPCSEYDVIIWDSALRRLSKPNIERVLQKIAAALKNSDGTFSCYEIFEDKEEPIDFITPLTADELKNMLGNHFSSVSCIQTETPGRTNYYFHCKDPHPAK